MRIPDSYRTTISLGRNITEFDVIIYYEYERCPMRINIYDVDVIDVWFWSEDGQGTTLDRQWLVDRGHIDTVCDALMRHIKENRSWYEDEISYDIDERDNEPDYPDDWED